MTINEARLELTKALLTSTIRLTPADAQVVKDFVDELLKGFDFNNVKVDCALADLGHKIEWTKKTKLTEDTLNMWLNERNRKHLVGLISVPRLVESYWRSNGRDISSPTVYDLFAIPKAKFTRMRTVGKGKIIYLTEWFKDKNLNWEKHAEYED